MNNLVQTHRLEGSIWIASDIHLGPSIPRTCDVFFEHLTQAYEQADHIILLGDIFNFWVGDDCPTFSLDAFHQARSASHHPAKLYIMRGNRDFLMGEKLAQELQATLLDDICIIENENERFLLLHGDQLCTDDKNFMRFRHFTHTPWIQKLFLALPKCLRIKIGRLARGKSKASHQYDGKMGDVNAEAVKDLFRTHPEVKAMIHGHTHRPDQILYRIEDKNYMRWVLEDWEKDHGQNRGGCIRIRHDQVTASHI